jgi:hypothetical protein
MIIVMGRTVDRSTAINQRGFGPARQATPSLARCRRFRRPGSSAALSRPHSPSRPSGARTLVL